ncbi:MAG: methyltransferase [Microbacterium sp.]|uniref:methyltransferase n=1 Tax=Microbacterium sp. TaxID=51671 RepID=UPI003A88D10F
MSDTQARRLWVAYGQSGAVGSIRHDDAGYTVTKAGADEPTGTYPSMDVAKNALYAQLKPGADWPEFREH